MFYLKSNKSYCTEHIYIYTYITYIYIFQLCKYIMYVYIHCYEMSFKSYRTRRGDLLCHTRRLGPYVVHTNDDDIYINSTNTYYIYIYIYIYIYMFMFVC